MFGKHPSWQIPLEQLFSCRIVPQLLPPSTLLDDSHKTSSDGNISLDRLLSSLRTDSLFQQEYLARLDASVQCVRAESQTTCQALGENLIEVLKKHYVQCRSDYFSSLEILRKNLGPTSDPDEQALDRYGQWPQITANVLLRYLASTSPIDIPRDWKKCLISFALLLLELQRARRLLRFTLDGIEGEFSKELENEGCHGWDPVEYPDWLLIQVGFFLSECPSLLTPLFVFVRSKETSSFVAPR